MKLHKYLNNNSSKTWITCSKGFNRLESFFSDFYTEAIPSIYLFTIDSHEKCEDCDLFIRHLSYKIIDEFEIEIPETLITVNWLVSDEHYDAFYSYQRNTLGMDNNNINTTNFNTLDFELKKTILGITYPIKAKILKKTENILVFVDMRTQWFLDFCSLNKINFNRVLIGNYTDEINNCKIPFEADLKIGECHVLKDVTPLRSFIDEYRQPLATIFEHYDKREFFDPAILNYFLELVHTTELDIHAARDLLSIGNIPEEVNIHISKKLPAILTKENYEHEHINSILKIEYLQENILKILINAITKIPQDQSADFYISCVLDDVKYLEAFSYINEPDFKTWNHDDQSAVIQHIASLIEDWGEDFSLTPAFLRKEPFILLSFVRVYFDRTNEEITLFKELVKENGLDKDYEFIIEILQNDDGSVAGIIADQSIKEMPDYHIEMVKAYYNYPREHYLHDQAICLIPDKFMNEFSFILELISINPEIIFSIKEHWRANEALCEIVLTKNGMLLEFLPESIKKNAHLAAIALKQNPAATIFISDELTYNVDFIRAVVNENNKILDYAIPRMIYLYHNE